jgi:hypothetical protein
MMITMTVMIVMTMVTVEVLAHFCFHPRAQWPATTTTPTTTSTTTNNNNNKSFINVLCNDAFDRSHLTATTGKKSVNSNGRHLSAGSEERRKFAASLDDLRALL